MLTLCERGGMEVVNDDNTAVPTPQKRNRRWVLELMPDPSEEELIGMQALEVLDDEAE